MKINSNIQALYANQQLKTTENKLKKITEKLSTGNKLNHAADGPVEYTMANKINAQIMGLKRASENVVDGKSITRIVDGVLGEVSDMIQRLNELAVQGSNETYSDEDRNSICDEMKQIVNEIDLLSKTTQFNKQNLIDGSFDLKGYTNNLNVSVKNYSDDVTKGIYNLDFSNLLSEQNGKINVNIDELKKTFPNVTYSSFEDNELKMQGINGFNMNLKLNKLPEDNSDKVNFVNGLGNVELNVTGFGAMTLQTGANAGQTLDIRIPNMSISYLGLDKIDFSSPEKCLDSLKYIDESLKYTNSARSRMGAYENKLDYHSDALAYEIENLTKSYSSIMDTDFATTMTEYSNLQVLLQANMAVLKQINDSTSMALQLLQ